MRLNTVTCPAGLQVVIREFEVEDEDLLGDTKAIKRGTATNDLLNAITVRVEEPGLYGFTEEKPNWNEVLQGERLEVLRENRISTWGSEFVFRLSCPRCSIPEGHAIDLEELEVQKLPESSYEHVSKGTPLEVTLPKEKRVAQFRLLRGKDDKGLLRIQKLSKKRLSSAYLKFRLIGIEGVTPPDLGDFIRHMSASDAAFLRAAFDEADCGVQQEIDFTCDTCDHGWREDVRFDKDFLFPKYRGRTAKAT